MRPYLFVIIILSNLRLVGQDLAASKQYFLQPFLLNPAIAGTTGGSELLLGHQQQWTGMQDAPSTQTLSYQTRIGNIGAGGCLVDDKNGFTQHYLAQAIFAYHINFTNKDLENVLSLGFAATLADNSVDETQFLQRKIDPAITGTRTDIYYPDFNFGTFYIDNSFTCGLSFKQLLSQKVGGVTEPPRPTYLFAQAGYNFQIDKEINILPSLVYTSGENWLRQLDINCKFFFLSIDNIRYWTGISYHLDLSNTMNNKLDILAATGLAWSHFILAYSYETLANGLVTSNSGSHQIVFGLNFGLNKRKKCPAYE